jgi:hypothetical protein
MNALTRQFSFTAPQVPLADPTDGLLPLKALEAPVEVNILIWDTMQTGHFVQLMLDDKLVGQTRAKTEDEHPGDIISMYLDEKYLAEEGSHVLAFKVTNPENGVYEDSPTTVLLVDRTAPGATLLAPAIFPQITFGDMLHGTIPGYAGMEPGDVIQTICNGVEGPALVISPDHLTKHPIQITLDRPFLDSLNSESVRVSYHVTDRAGNRSVHAQAVDLTYQRSMLAN